MAEAKRVHANEDDEEYASMGARLRQARAIAIERECQRVVALGKIPRHDEQGRTARGQDRAVCRSRWNEDSH